MDAPGVQTAFQGLVMRSLIKPLGCYRHCDQPTRWLQLYMDSDKLVGAYVCPSNYVSRVAYFTTRLDLDWFKGLLQKRMSGDLLVDEDLRVATRHGWELGVDAPDLVDAMLNEQQGGGMTHLGPYVSRVCYWIPRKTGAMTKDSGPFICPGRTGKGGCGNIFLYNNGGSSPLCPTCSSSKP